MLIAVALVTGCQAADRTLHASMPRLVGSENFSHSMQLAIAVADVLSEIVAISSLYILCWYLTCLIFLYCTILHGSCTTSVSSGGSLPSPVIVP